VGFYSIFSHFSSSSLILSSLIEDRDEGLLITLHMQHQIVPFFGQRCYISAEFFWRTSGGLTCNCYIFFTSTKAADIKPRACNSVRVASRSRHVAVSVKRTRCLLDFQQHWRTARSLDNRQVTHLRNRRQRHLVVVYIMCPARDICQIVRRWHQITLAGNANAAINDIQHAVLTTYDSQHWSFMLTACR